MKDNPLHDGAPALSIVKSTVVPASASTSVVLHTLRLSHRGWVWHVHVQWSQLQALAASLQRWRWRAFFFRGLVPPQGVDKKEKNKSKKQARTSSRVRTRSKDDDYVNGWSSTHPAAAAAEEEEEEAQRPPARGRGRERRRRSARPKERRALSAPPSSSESHDDNDDDEESKPPPLGLEYREEDMVDGERDRRRRRKERLQRRREEEEQQSRRRWAYLAHIKAWTDVKHATMPIPKMKDVRCPLTKEQASNTDAASVAHQRTVYEPYLRAVLDDVVNRHCPALLELLQVSKQTFDLAQGPSHREGYVAHVVWWSSETASALSKQQQQQQQEEEEEEERGLELEGLRPRDDTKGGLLASLLKKKRRRVHPPTAAKLQKGWAVLKHSYLAFYKKNTTADLLPDAVLLFDTGTTLQASVFDAPTCLVLRNPLWHFELSFPSLVEHRQWAAALQTVLAQAPWVERDRFAFTRSLPMSYLDESGRSAAQWFVDGDAAYKSFEAAMRGAKVSIFLSAQWLCPDLYLLRPAHRFPQSRLDRLLERKAQEGVQICVLLFQEPWGGNMVWNSRYTQARLMGLQHHGKMHVLLAGNPTFPQAWTHHESLLCVDQELAFVGSGLSFGLGEYDTPHHVLKDDVVVPARGRGRRLDGGVGEEKGEVQVRQPVWCGRDYHNPLVKDMCQVDLAGTAADLPGHNRGTVPRMPQHTATVALTGGGARDLCWHFINRWNLGRARELGARQAIPSKKIRQEEFPFPLPPALFPLHMWRMRVQPPPVVARAQGATAALSVWRQGPQQQQQESCYNGHKAVSDVMVRKTIARLVFGADSSVAMPAPPSSLLLQEEERSGPTDLITKVEGRAAQKVQEWLRPRRERVRCRLLEMQHDVNTTAQAELLHYQSMVETPLAPLGRRPPSSRLASSVPLSLPSNEDMQDDNDDDQASRSSRGMRKSSHSSSRHHATGPYELKTGGHLDASSPSFSSAPSPSKQQLILSTEAAKTLARQQHRQQLLLARRREEQHQYQQGNYQYQRLRRALYVRELEEEEEEEASMGPLAQCHCRVARSLGRWSGGLRVPQASIMEAYEQIISTADHFLYFENPSFISGLRGDTDVSNRVAEVLLNRIVQAHDNKMPFRVMILLPLLPVYKESLHGATPTMLTSALYWQLTSVKALWTKLSQMVPHPDDYLQFFGLRTYGWLNGDASSSSSDMVHPHLVTEQIFVNSRLLVADDRHVVVGSAALNERSLLGTRDSELGVILEDMACTPGRMDRRPYQAGTFARSLRLRLWGEHVGLLEDYVQRRVMETVLVEEEGAQVLLFEDEDPDQVYAPLLDPTAPCTWAYLRGVARKNTAILAHVFPQALPSNTVRSLEALKQVQVEGVTLQATRDFVESVLGEERAAEEEEALVDALLDEEEFSFGGGTGAEDDDASVEGHMDGRDAEKEKLKWLGRLQGHLVEYPLDFLADDLATLRPSNGLQGWTM